MQKQLRLLQLLANVLLHTITNTTEIMHSVFHEILYCNKKRLQVQ